MVLPSGAQIIDAQGGAILPGIIDSHVHTAWSPEVRHGFLEAGVTSVCDMGSPIEHMPEFEEVTWDGIPVARGFRAGPIVTAPGGLPDAVLHADLNYEVGTPEEARAGVEELVGRGADVFKVYLHETTGNVSYPVLDEPVLQALVEEAHAQGIMVRAHVAHLAMVPLALDAGVDVIDHLPKPDLSEEGLTQALKDSDDAMADLYGLFVVAEYDDLLPRMVEQGVVLAPTLAIDVARQYLSEEATPGERVVQNAER